MVTDREFWERVASFKRTVRYHHGRLPPSDGVLGRMDCVGPAFCAAWSLGLDCPNFLDYSEQPSQETLKAALRERAIERPWSEWSRVGRILVLKLTQTLDQHGRPSFRAHHVAYMGPDRIAAVIEDKFRLVTMDDERVESVWLLHGVESTC